MRIIVVGYGELASSITLGAIEAGHEVVAFYRWERVNANPVFLKIKDYFNPGYEFNFIKSLKLREINAPSVNSEEFRKQALKLTPDLIIVASWGEILKKKTFDIPKIASINCHPSMLPTHRGSNPYYSTIRYGETTTGVTFHLIDETLDTGPILLQKQINIAIDDTGATLRTKCAYTARELVKKLLAGLVTANIIPKPQDKTIASYYPRVNEDDTMLDWRKSALELHNQIRGSYPWIPCYTRHKNEFLKIEKSKLVDIKDLSYEPGTVFQKGKNSMLVATQDHNALHLSGIKVYGMFKEPWSNYYLNNSINVGDKLLNFDSIGA